MHNPIDRITHTTAFVTPVVENWLEREIAQWVHSMKDRSDDPLHHERMLLPQSLVKWCPTYGKGSLYHHYMGYSFWLAARVLLYALSHEQDSTYHGLSYTALAGMRNSSMGPPWGIDLMTHHTISERYITELHLALWCIYSHTHAVCTLDWNIN